MKNRYSKILVLVSLIAVFSVEAAIAGNDDRRGTAGANELLINPWARSAGWGGVNCIYQRCRFIYLRYN